MRMILILFIGGLATVQVVGCASTPIRDVAHYPFPEAQAELRQTLEAIINDAETVNMQGLRDAHLNSDKFTKFSGSTYERRNFEQTVESETAAITSRQDYKYEAKDLKIDVFGEVAVMTYYSDRSYKEDGELIQYSARQTFVFLKTADGWKIVHEHKSGRKDEE